MNRSEFMNTRNLEESIPNRDVTACGYKFNWLDIRGLGYERNFHINLHLKKLSIQIQTFIELI